MSKEEEEDRGCGGKLKKIIRDQDQYGLPVGLTYKR
jgi:hypothetical protein